jgi:hypothetical protein
MADLERPDLLLPAVANTDDFAALSAYDQSFNTSIAMTT